MLCQPGFVLRSPSHDLSNRTLSTPMETRNRNRTNMHTMALSTDRFVAKQNECLKPGYAHQRYRTIGPSGESWILLDNLCLEAKPDRGSAGASFQVVGSHNIVKDLGGILRGYKPVAHKHWDGDHTQHNATIGTLRRKFSAIMFA